MNPPQRPGHTDRTARAEDGSVRGSPADAAPVPALPGLPTDDGGPVFRAPWEAQAFALALSLHERGVFAWPEFAAALTQAIGRAQAAGDPDTGSTYYRHWLDALESLVLAKGIGDADRLHALERAWAEAAARTPHGQPITLAATAGDHGRAAAPSGRSAPN